MYSGFCFYGYVKSAPWIHVFCSVLSYSQDIDIDWTQLGGNTSKVEQKCNPNFVI